MNTLPKNLQRDLVFWGGYSEGSTTFVDLMKLHTVTPNNSPTKQRRCQSAGTTFNGSNQNIAITDASDLEPGSNVSFTLATWYKSSSASTYQAIYTSRATGTPTAFIDLYLNWNGGAGTIDSYLWDWGTQIITTSNISANDGKYHLLVLVRDITNTKLNLYFDGYLIANPTLTRTGSTANTDSKYIGGRSSNNYFAGDITNTMFWNGRALNSTEINSLRNSLYIK